MSVGIRVSARWIASVVAMLAITFALSTAYANEAHAATLTAHVHDYHLTNQLADGTSVELTLDAGRNPSAYAVKGFDRETDPVGVSEYGMKLKITVQNDDGSPMTEGQVVQMPISLTYVDEDTGDTAGLLGAFDAQTTDWTDVLDANGRVMGEFRTVRSPARFEFRVKGSSVGATSVTASIETGANAFKHTATYGKAWIRAIIVGDATHTWCNARSILSAGTRFMCDTSGQTDRSAYISASTSRGLGTYLWQNSGTLPTDRWSGNQTIDIFAKNAIGCDAPGSSYTSGKRVLADGELGSSDGGLTVRSTGFDVLGLPTFFEHGMVEVTQRDGESWEQFKSRVTVGKYGSYVSSEGVHLYANFGDPVAGTGFFANSKLMWDSESTDTWVRRMQNIGFGPDVPHAELVRQVNVAYGSSNAIAGRETMGGIFAKFHYNKVIVDTVQPIVVTVTNGSNVYSTDETGGWSVLLSPSTGSAKLTPNSAICGVYDETTDDAIVGSIVELQRNDGGVWTTVSGKVTNDAGVTSMWTSLAKGTYRFYVSDATGYNAPKASETFTVTDDDQGHALIVYLKRSYGHVSITKVDADDDAMVAQGSARMQGAQFGVYSDAACTNLVTTITIGADMTGSTGDTLWTGLNPYYIKETKAPTGYKLNTTVYVVNAVE